MYFNVIHLLLFRCEALIFVSVKITWYVHMYFLITFYAFFFLNPSCNVW